jgi:hypothetical protein
VGSAHAPNEKIVWRIGVLPDPGMQRAVLELILALREGDRAAFLALLPARGVELRERRGKGRLLSRADVEARLDPTFLGLAEAGTDMKVVDWFVDAPGRQRIEVHGNGMASVAVLAPGEGRQELVLVFATSDED